MYVIADVCVVPVGVGTSVSKYVKACQDIFSALNLTTHLHAYGTNIEGDWDQVMLAVKQCHEVIHAMGSSRISTTIKLGTRTDKRQTMRDKVNSVLALD